MTGYLGPKQLRLWPGPLSEDRSTRYELALPTLLSCSILRQGYFPDWPKCPHGPLMTVQSSGPLQPDIKVRNSIESVDRKNFLLTCQLLLSCILNFRNFVVYCDKEDCQLAPCFIYPAMSHLLFIFSVRICAFAIVCRKQRSFYPGQIKKKQYRTCCLGEII